MNGCSECRQVRRSFHDFVIFRTRPSSAAGALAKRVEGVVHPGAELVEPVWTPLERARELDLPRITHLALDDLAAALRGGLDPRRPRPFYRELRGKRLREEL